MKVIRRGRTQKGWAREEKCTGIGYGEGGCGAELLVEEEDMYLHKYSDGEGGTESCISFKCCECGVWSEMKKVPSAIFTRIRESGRNYQAVLSREGEKTSGNT